jgi:hypothetical protein
MATFHNYCCENLKSYRVTFDSTDNFQHNESLCLVLMLNLMDMNQYLRSNVTQYDGKGL